MMYMKKILLPLMAGLLQLSATAQTFTVGELTYEVTGDGAVSVSACNSSATGSLEIPATVHHKGADYSVTGIEEDAFWNYGGLTAVTVPASVTSIEDGAFYNCSGLTAIDVEAANGAYCSVEGVLFNKEKTEIAAYPVGRSGSYDLLASVTSIGDKAFANGSKLTAVTMPASVTNIGKSAFANCSGLTALSLPAAVTSIGDYAFNGCSGLTAMTLPATVTNIGGYAFYNCSGLTAMTLPAAVTNIGDAAFRNCSGLTAIDVEAANSAYCSVEGVLFNKAKTEIAAYPAGRTGSYDLPASVTSIGKSAFADCSGLTAVTLPASVTSIGDGAFNGCRRLTAIILPAAVTSIGESAFAGCSGLTTVTLPAAITSIGGSTFAGCSSLTAIVLPAAVTSIESSTFAGCSSLAAVTLPATVTSIGESAFVGCNSLTTLTLPASVTNIGTWAISSCANLTSIYMESPQPPSTAGNALDYLPYSCVVYVPTGAGKAYKAVKPWNTFTIKEYNGPTGIEAVTTAPAQIEVYTIDGRRAGRFGSVEEARRQLPAGPYVVNGKKVLF